MTDKATPLPPRRRLEPLQGGGLRVLAPAKINLNLLVAPRGQDGYHPLDSFVAKVTLYDEIELRPRPDGQIAFGCRGADCGKDEDNLALRAARLMRDFAPAAAGADIRLTKRIPPGAGLGGGSSDAAAVLAGLNELWNLSHSREQLMQAAERLGSDVPLFLGPPAARMTGRGQRIEEVQVHPFRAVLLMPGCPCSTAEVYQKFDLKPEPAASQLDARLLAGPPSGWRRLLQNQLCLPACNVSPKLAEVWRRLTGRGDQLVCLTGSGSTLFMLCDDDHEAAAVLAAIPQDLRPCCLVVRNNPW
jgi:4-diphosphocytidyl-2-C-methyl-D-erythritol kinase